MSLFTKKPATKSTLSPYDDALKSIHRSGTWGIVLGIINIIISPLFEDITYTNSSANGYSKAELVLSAFIIGLVVGVIFIALGVSLKLARSNTIRMANRRLIYLTVLLIITLLVGFIFGSHSAGLINILAIFDISQARTKIRRLGSAIKTQQVRSKKFVVGISVLVVLVIAAAIGGARAVVSHSYGSWVVDGPAMNPTYTNGEKVLATKTYPTPKISDVVLFHSPNDGTILIKRIVATAGDKVVIQNGDVSVYSGSTKVYESSSPSTPGNVSLTIPTNNVYVLGDNRSDSLDSRSFGPVPTSDIIGKVITRI